MDYFNLAFIAIIILQNIVFRKIMNSKLSKKELESLKDEVSLSTSRLTEELERKVEDAIAIWNSDWRTQMVELDNFCHRLATSQREEMLNVLTKVNDLQKKLVKSGSTMAELKEDVKLIAKNPNKARRKFLQDEDQ